MGSAWESSAEPGVFDAGFMEMGLGCEDEAPTCEPGSCPAGTSCLSDGCGRQLCQPAGLPCLDAADCSAGSACIDGPLGSVCARAEGCGDARDCPAGFACEGGACRDRRVFCLADADCPASSYCELSLTIGEPTCHPIDRVCAHDAACAAGSLCLDPDGDGELRCVLD